jgi:hypothetical protein
LIQLNRPLAQVCARMHALQRLACLQPEWCALRTTAWGHREPPAHQPVGPRAPAGRSLRS